MQIILSGILCVKINEEFALTRKVFHDILGFRAFCDSYDDVLMLMWICMLALGSDPIKFTEMPNNHHLENPSVIDWLLPWSKELPEQCKMKRNRKKCLKQ